MEEPLLILTHALDAAAEGGEAPSWNELAAAMHMLLEQPPSAGRRELFYRLFVPGPEVPVRRSAHGPHIMSPRNMLRLMAARALADEEVEHIRPRLERFAADPETPGLLRTELARRLRR